MNEVRNFKVGSPSTSCKKIMNFLGEKLWEGYKYPTYYHHIVDLKGERINRGMRVYVFFLKKKGGGIQESALTEITSNRGINF